MGRNLPSVCWRGVGARVVEAVCLPAWALSTVCFGVVWCGVVLVWCTARVSHASPGRRRCVTSLWPRHDSHLQAGRTCGLPEGAGTSFGHREAVLSTLAAAGLDRARFLPRCLPPCIFIPTLSLLPAHPYPPKQPSTHILKREKDEASEREACIGLYSILVRSWVQRCRLLSASLFFIPTFGVGSRRLAFLVNELFRGFL